MESAVYQSPLGSFFFKFKKMLNLYDCNSYICKKKEKENRKDKQKEQGIYGLMYFGIL